MEWDDNYLIIHNNIRFDAILCYISGMMKPQNSYVHFRANDALLTAAEDRARRKGLSLSAFLRHALMRQLEDLPIAADPIDFAAGGKR